MEREKLIALVQGVQKGDEDALAEIYSAFHDDLYYYIYKTVNDPELAADLTQDTFIEILQSIQSLQEPAAFVTWSRQIAYRRCTAYFKKRHDFLVDEDEDGYSVFDTIEEDRTEFIPDAALDKADLRQTIYNIINELPEEQRSAIMMRYFDELPLADVARIQGVSEGTVKSRLNYGRKSIKQAVESYEKKTGIKLHCVGVVPLLLWLLREFRVSSGLSTTTGAAKAVGLAGVKAASAQTAASAVGAAPVAAGAAKAIAIGGAAKAATAAVTTKIVAIAVAATVVAGSLGVGVSHLVKNSGHSTSKKTSSSRKADTTQSTPEKDCTHQWNSEYTCTLCDLACPHDSVTEQETPVAEGIVQKQQTCNACGWHQEAFALVHGDQPIRITSHPEFISQCLTETSHKNMLEQVIDLQNTGLSTSYDPETTTVTVAGTLYFYNDTWDESSTRNNRLVIIYHYENGIVPGGWYTFLGVHYDMEIRSFTDEAGNPYFSTVATEHLTGSGSDSINYLVWEYIREGYSFWIDSAYPTSFVYNEVRYVGHTDFQDCLKSLCMNGDSELGTHYDHLYVTGDIKQFKEGY